MLNHIHIYNMDYIDLINKIPSESVDLIITDPPYRTTTRGSAGGSGGMFTKDINKKGKVFEYNDVKIKEFMPHLYRVLKQNSHCYIMTNHVNLHEMLDVAKECGFHFIKSLIWNKGNKIMGQSYMSQFEYILFFRKGRHKKINKCGTADILNIPNIKTKDCDGKNLHDTEKPVELWKVLIANSTLEGQIAYDPFCGIGGSAVACKELNRVFIGSEIDKNYYNIALERLGV